MADQNMINESFDPKMQEAQAITIKNMQQEFVQSYLNKPESVDTKEWLKAQMASKLPETPLDQINAYADEITSTLETIEQNKVKLEAANNNGRPVESWFYNELRTANSNMSAQEAGKYLQALDKAIQRATDELTETISTKSGQVNQNPSLHGFIAEQHHANTFNLEAEATGSVFRARVLKPENGGYGANSLDIVIENKNTGKIASRYQVKYGKDAKATAEAFERGDYRGQQKLVPAGQEGAIGKKATATLEAPDGTKSKPLSIDEAKRMQKDAQSGKTLEYDYNDYSLKQLSYSIAKEAGKSALLGAAVGGGIEIAKQVWKEEKINGEELVKKALQSGADAGAKAATAGALKVLAERGALTILPKGTSACAITAIASLAVDNVKVFAQAANGQMSAKEAFYTMEQNTVATIAGTVVSVEGAAIGATIGLVLGPVGSFVGGLVGGFIAFMAGSTLGRAVTKAVQQVREVALSYVSTAVNAAAKTATAIGNAVVNGIKNFAGAFFSQL